MGPVVVEHHLTRIFTMDKASNSESTAPNGKIGRFQVVVFSLSDGGILSVVRALDEDRDCFGIWKCNRFGLS